MSTKAIPTRSLSIAHLAFFLACVLGIVVSANYFAMRPEWQTRLDATKTRAYSLSPQTRQLLADLEGPWTIALIVSENRLDRAMGKQIDEVLARYTAVAPNINVTRIDIDDPSTLPQYDQLLAQLQSVYRDQVQAYDIALDQGTMAFDALLLFAQQRSAELETLITRLPAGDTDADLAQKRAGVFGLLADQGELVVAEVDKARRMSDARPVPDYDGARSILAQALTQWALEVDDLAEFFDRTMKRSDLEPAVRQYASAARQDYSDLAERLAGSADVLKRLPELELSGIGRQLGEGEAAVIVGPNRAAVIPSTQLFPKSNVRQKHDGGISFDQRFRGEQLLSAAIRSLVVPHMPLVVFMHAEESTLLQRRERKDELVGVTAVLRSSRFEVQEWMLAKNKTRPLPKPGQQVVFVLVPPPPARSLEPTPAMAALVQAVTQLITDGMPVLLSVGPSLLPKYGQTDPYATMAAPFGIELGTGMLLLETTPVAPGQSSTTLGQAMNDFDSDSVIARAIDGQQTYFGMPVPVKLSAQPPSGTRQDVVAAVKADASRWLEKEWTGDLASREPPPLEARLKEAVPMVVAAERPHPMERGMQRIIVVGSGGWMASNVADPVVEVGGGRVALVNPGNHELMLASVAWLAGMDDLIAAGPLGQEIPRLRNVTADDRLLWGWILIAGVPTTCLMLAGIVFLARRR